MGAEQEEKGEQESRMTRPYHLSVIKKISTKTESELAEIRAKYKDGVPSEIIDHLSEKMALVVIGADTEPRIRELPNRRRMAE